MITLKSKEQIAVMREAGQKLAFVLDALRREVQPGRTTKFFDELSHRLILEGGAEPVFLGYEPAGSTQPYPATLCIGVNDAVVHTPPSGYVLKEGDVVKLDLGLRYKKLCVDAAITVGVGSIPAEAKKLIYVTEEALGLGIAEAEPGKKLGDIGAAVQTCVERAGFSIVRMLTGHGIGHDLHEEPSVFNFGKKGTGLELRPGLVIAIEPITAVGSGRIKQIGDDSYVTEDHSVAAHFEHTVAITDHGPEILTKLA